MNTIMVLENSKRIQMMRMLNNLNAKMKALEILEAITENEGTHLWLDDGGGYPKSYIYEAIKELESISKELNDYIEMEKWMEENSNTSLCDYYNREENK